MIRSIGRRAGTTAGVLAIAAAAFGMFQAPAGAATTNPCKVLKKSEIQQAFGGTVSSGKKGLSTPVSSQCEFQVGDSYPRSDVSSAGQSGWVRARSEMTLTRSASSTARLTYFPPSPRWCLITSRPGAATSSTMHDAGTIRVVPHTCSVPSLRQTPR